MLLVGVTNKLAIVFFLPFCSYDRLTGVKVFITHFIMIEKLLSICSKIYGV